MCRVYKYSFRAFVPGYTTDMSTLHEAVKRARASGALHNNWDASVYAVKGDRKLCLVSCLVLPANGTSVLPCNTMPFYPRTATFASTTAALSSMLLCG